MSGSKGDDSQKARGILLEVDRMLSDRVTLGAAMDALSKACELPKGLNAMYVVSEVVKKLNAGDALAAEQSKLLEVERQACKGLSRELDGVVDSVIAQLCEALGCEGLSPQPTLVELCRMVRTAAVDASALTAALATADQRGKEQAQALVAPLRAALRLAAELESAEVVRRAMATLDQMQKEHVAALSEKHRVEELYQAVHERLCSALGGDYPARSGQVTFAQLCAEVEDRLHGESADQPAPIPMRLHCPECHALHVDGPQMAPHRTHACQVCGALWAPAVVETRGVRFLPGCKDPGVIVYSPSEDEARAADRENQQ